MTHAGRIVQAAAGRGINIFFWTRCFGKGYIPLHADAFHGLDIPVLEPVLQEWGVKTDSSGKANLMHNQPHQLFVPRAAV